MTKALAILLLISCLLAVSVDAKRARYSRRNTVDPPPLKFVRQVDTEVHVQVKQVKTDGSSSMTPDCVGYSTCNECIEAPECGWCATAAKCVLGTGNGPEYGVCSEWDFTSCSSGQTLSPAPSSPPSGECPLAPSGIFGGYSYAGFCWYFADNTIDACDVTCANVGGTNLAYEAEYAFNGSNLPISTDVTSVIYYDYDNPDDWTGPSTGYGGCHTLGWYCPTLCSSGPGVYFGKDLSNTLACGTFPGEQNYPGNWVTPICACAYSSSY
eukprot:TRINITY_DN486_c0_g1_i2.p2 TRINITY_DN486_c0_g1~~TRINITY_DN486_c0_g1_i2.p2  ORF type:complete len:268 (-),score=53.18 TRINITY_DN486_c0_g1_i2:71-874(-)